ncbi:dephospho-CoA kinase [Pasteurellaceae bacterium HPA106]|uniref:dephospho-CoA kinase n=1 Tax=Spirabiliibacterium pneumoniae TaxID=221400 RepID=UPI001AACEDE2|nr:dephospho-CoA kinase [Spirabiliibacterium pneumoniae]MBE2896212.1 dephospho-CoA kinase [Spirabiliibacterium pneumoniae]
MTYIVGLTGGIGSGKSTIADLFAALGVPVVDADVVAREVVAKGSTALLHIAEHFGDEVLNADGSLNRAALRARVFNDCTQTQWLNDLLHPLIRKKMLAELNAVRAPYALWVVPLLFENHLEAFCDRTLVVDVSRETQIERATRRDSNKREQIEKIIAAQIDRDRRLTTADDVINNDEPWQESQAEITARVAKLHQFYLDQAKKKYEKNER